MNLVEGEHIYTVEGLVYGICKGYGLLGLVLPTLICMFVHYDYNTGLIQNMYASAKNRQEILYWKIASIAFLLFCFQLASCFLGLAIISISSASISKGFTWNAMVHWLIYYILCMYVVSICMLISYLVRNTIFASIVATLLIVPFGLLEEFLLKKLPKIVQNVFLLSDIFDLSHPLQIYQKILYLCNGIVYIIILVFLMRRIIRKEDL